MFWQLILDNVLSVDFRLSARWFILEDVMLDNFELYMKCFFILQMCYTMVDNGLISKGCAPRIPFVEHRQCVDNGTKCVYLCNKNDCNMKTHEGIMGK